MKSFKCRCGNTIFFENTLCVACKHDLGWCPACRTMTALISGDDGVLRCGHDPCGTPLMKCHNYAVENVCNRCCLVPAEPPTDELLCDYCRFNDTIPDLSVPGNREKWHRLESAKRRLLYVLDLMRLPYGNADDGIQPELSFDFKADHGRSDRFWWKMGKQERVFTGHVNGKIVINLLEADTVEREKARVIFQEAHRTLIGHFRHEIGHYYWQMLVEHRCEPACIAVFGDHQYPTYAEAQKRYYSDKPLDDWQANYISAYATMHPWEDFAETFAAYLDIVSVLDTAQHMGVMSGVDPFRGELRDMADSYIRLGVVLNEMNRTMGLLDYVPEILDPPVLAKMHFIHDLVRNAAKPA